MNDSTCRCTKCGRTVRVSFGSSLRNGWPKCCGYTMTLTTTTADIERATTGAIAAQLPSR